VPFVQGLRLVEAFVALEPNEPATKRFGAGASEVGLSDACGALDEERTAHLQSEPDREGGLRLDEIARCGERACKRLRSVWRVSASARIRDRSVWRVSASARIRDRSVWRVSGLRRGGPGHEATVAPWLVRRRRALASHPIPRNIGGPRDADGRGLVYMAE